MKIYYSRNMQFIMSLEEIIAMWKTDIRNQENGE